MWQCWSYKAPAGRGSYLLEIITAALALICVVKQCDTFVNQQANNTNLESQKEFVSLKPGGSFFPHPIAINTLSGQRFWLLLLPPEPCMVRSGSGTVMWEVTELLLVEERSLGSQF